MSYSEDDFDSVSSDSSIQEILSSTRSTSRNSKKNGNLSDLFVKKSAPLRPKTASNQAQSDNLSLELQLSETPVDSDLKNLNQVPIKQIENSLKIIEKLNKEHKDNSNRNIDLSFVEDQLLEEYIGLTTLNFIAYGESHLNHAKSYVQLAKFYLEIKSFPKQSEKNCTIAKNIMVFVSNSDYSQEDIEEYEMMFNYINGRTCTILKKNLDGEKHLENAEEHFKNLKNLKASEANNDYLNEWNIKIKIALAKQYAINQKYSNSIVYYEKVVKYLRNSPELFKDLIFVLKDKAKINSIEKNYEKALETLDLALQVSSDNLLEDEMLNCKIEKAKVYMQMEDLINYSNAEKLLQQCVDADFESSDEIIVKKLEASEELVRCFILQELFEDAKRFAEQLAKKQINFYGDYHINVSTTYKLLSSVCLKLNDMPSAAVYLKKCIEIEELNYGPKNKKVNQTKELFENLKKNPQVAKKLNISNNANKPKFVAAKKKDTRKEDLELYKENDTIDYSKKIMPIK